MNAPVRIQLKRTKGWRMPENTVKVDRTTRWGNPYRIGDRYSIDGMKFGKVKDAQMAVDLFRRRHIRGRTEIIHLRGKNLACWCKPGEPCHADVLLEIANRPLAFVEDDAT